MSGHSNRSGPRPAGLAPRLIQWLAVLLALLLQSACSSLPVAAPAAAPTDLGQAVPGLSDQRAPFAALFNALFATQSATVPPPAAPPPAAEGAASAAVEPARWLRGPAATPLPTAELKRLQARVAAVAPSTSVLIVPGLLGDCVDRQSVPFGDGVTRDHGRSQTEAYRIYDDLGLQGLRALPLPGRESATRNGLRLADILREEARRPGVRHIVLLAYSKGLADAFEALAELQASQELPPALGDLVSVAGAVGGTPLADAHEALFEDLSPLLQLLDCSPSDGKELAGLTTRERRSWLQAHPLPPGLRLYSVLAHSPSAPISPGLRLARWELDRIDTRNDGQLLAQDALLPDSQWLVEADADHWTLALPLERHPSALVRLISAGQTWPRETLLRALLTWVLGQIPLSSMPLSATPGATP